MEKKKNTFKMIVSMVLVYVLVFSLIIQNVSFDKTIAAGGNLVWNQNKVLNYQGHEIDTTDNEIMVEFPIQNTGRYILSFYTPDTYAYTLAGEEGNENGEVVRHVITLTKSVSTNGEHTGTNQVLYNHKIYIWDTATGDFTHDITTEYLTSFLEWDFNAQPVPSFYVSTENEINYIVYDGDTWGKIYQVAGQTFKFVWDKKIDMISGLDIDTIKLSMENLAGIRNGTMYPFTFVPQGQPAENLEILKSVQITSEPKRWAVTDDSPFTFTDDKEEVSEMKENDSSMVRPGLLLNITRPKKYNTTSHKFEDISASDANGMEITLNFESRIAQIMGIDLGELPLTDNIYKLNIIGYGVCTGGCDANCPHNKLSRQGDTAYLLRETLEDSSVYNVELILETDGGLVKSAVRSYTYMQFDVLRRSINETYIELEPYEYPGSYEIYVLGSKTSNDANFFSTFSNRWAEHYITDEANIPEKVYVPVYMTRSEDSTENWYTVGVKFKETGAYEGNYVNSETVFYDANADKDITLDVPYLDSPSNIIVINDEDENTKASSFNVTWDFPIGLFDGEGLYRILNNPDEKIWYEVLINTSEQNKEDNEYQVLDVISLKRNADGTIAIRNRAGTFIDTLTQDDKKFDVQITLKDVEDSSWAPYIIPNWIGLYNDLKRPLQSEADNVGTYIEGANQNSTYKNGFFNPNVDKVPGNYFITMRAYYDPNDEDEKLTISDYALPINVYLNEIEEFIEVPSKVNITDVKDDKFKIAINPVKIENYEKKMLTPIKAEVVDDAAKYQILFSQDENVLLNLLKSTEIVNMEQLNAINGVHKIIGEFTDADLNSDGYIPIEIGTTPNTTVSELRSNIVYSLISNNTNIQFANLDKNQSYYVAVRSVLDIEEDGVADIYRRYSEISTVYFTRTGTDIVVPDSDEKMPPTPINFRKDESPTDKEVVIRWEEPNLVDEAGYSYGYEVIRVADRNLEELERAATRTVANLNASSYNAFKAYRVINDVLYIYDTNANEWILNNGNDSYEHVVTPEYMKITDVGVNPNRLYYYYVRTLKFKEEPTGLEDDTNSEWSELSATTTPITGVENLKEVIVSRTYGITDLNEFYEAMFSFEAPIGDAVLGTSNPSLPTGIDFSIQTKLILDTIYTAPTSVTLVAIVAKDTDTATYVYRLSQLESGSKYNVRVAMIDQSSTDANGNYAMSSYCDSIAIRTEFSQEDYDRKDKYSDYEEYYEVILNKIVNDVKYVIEDSKDLYAVKYKEDKFLGELGRLSEGTYLLETKEDVNEYEYYISQACIEEMKRLKKGLRIVKDDVSIILPYRFIDSEYTEEYVEMLDTIKDKNDVIDDFYIKISVSFNNAPEYIGTKKTLSKAGKIDLGIVELESLNAEIDYAIESEVLSKIANEKDDFLQELYDVLDGKIDDEKYLELIEEKKQTLIDLLAEKIAASLTKYEDDEYEIENLYSPVNIKIENINSDAKIMSKSSGASWKQLNTNSSLGMLSAYMYELGSFVLAREYDMTINYGNELTKNAANIKEKYQLYDVFIQTGTLDQKNGTVSIALFRNIVFTILTIDNSNIYEKANIMKQVTSTYDFDNDPITRQEAIYGIMQLYNSFSPTDINKLNVKNGDVIADIPGVNNYVKQSILAGIELGLITHDDVVGPTELITPEQLLDLIYKIIG